MNDTELDEFLDSWTTPRVPVSLRETVYHRFLKRQDSRSMWATGFFKGGRKRHLAVSLAGVALVLFGITQALPQTLRLTSDLSRIPYSVESDFIRLSEDGSPAVESSIVSYADQYGNEIILSTTFPGRRLRTVFRRSFDALGFILMQVSLPFRSGVEKQRRIQETKNLVHSDCALNAVVVGHETILNYPATAVEFRLINGEKVTIWRAAALGCFTLRMMSEVAGPDGKFHVVWLKEATKVSK